jgi:hypothetical protein
VRCRSSKDPIHSRPKIVASYALDFCRAEKSFRCNACEPVTAWHVGSNINQSAALELEIEKTPRILESFSRKRS